MQFVKNAGWHYLQFVKNAGWHPVPVPFPNEASLHNAHVSWWERNIWFTLWEKYKIPSEPRKNRGDRKREALTRQYQPATTSSAQTGKMEFQNSTTWAHHPDLTNWPRVLPNPSTAGADDRQSSGDQSIDNFLNGFEGKSCFICGRPFVWGKKGSQLFGDLYLSELASILFTGNALWIEEYWVFASNSKHKLGKLFPTSRFGKVSWNLAKWLSSEVWTFFLQCTFSQFAQKCHVWYGSR